MLLSLLNEIAQLGTGSVVSPAEANRCAEEIIDELAAMLNALWEDCPESSKDIYRETSEGRIVEQSKIRQPDLEHLTQKGFMKRSGAKVVSNSRFLERYLASHGDDSGSMIRLFGAPESFRSNIRALLERRLAQLPRLDTKLRRFIERAIA